MIRIAFCDNAPAILQELSEWTQAFFKEHPITMEYVAFSNSFDLLTQMECGRLFDILFLNTDFIEGNGLDIAKDVRKIDQNVKIVFLSSSAAYAVASYTVRAFSYQLKPMRQDTFCQLMQHLLSEIAHETTRGFLIRSQDTIYRILASNIEYCEVCNRIVSIHLIDGSVLQTSMRFKELEDLLAAKENFLRTHRFYIVNMDYISTISKDGITMTNGNTVPISHGKLKYIRSQCLEYYA